MYYVTHFLLKIEKKENLISILREISKKNSQIEIYVSISKMSLNNLTSIASECFVCHKKIDMVGSYGILPQSENAPAHTYHMVDKNEHIFRNTVSWIILPHLTNELYSIFLLPFQISCGSDVDNEIILTRKKMRKNDILSCAREGAQYWNRFEAWHVFWRFANMKS